jgi:hypothetical protein
MNVPPQDGTIFSVSFGCSTSAALTAYCCCRADRLPKVGDVAFYPSNSDQHNRVLQHAYGLSVFIQGWFQKQSKESNKENLFFPVLILRVGDFLTQFFIRTG